MLRLSSVFSLIFFFLPLISYGEDLNAGFVQGLWYSSPTVYANIPARVYVALRNNTSEDLTSTVRFTDNGKSLGVSSVSALPGRLVEAWANWTPTFGEHKIVATLSDVKLHIIGSTTESVQVESTIAEDTIFVDYDTDTDTIGNKDDLDDDNDGIPDTVEVEQGTDPLVRNPKKPVETPSQTENQNTTTSTIKDTQTASAIGAVDAKGLEQFIETGTVNTILSNVTDKVSEVKQSLDTYREKRADEMNAYFNPPRATSPSDVLSSSTTSSSTQSNTLATITRSRINTDAHDKHFIQSAIAGGKALVSWLYGIFLWILSALLGHPILVQLGILFGILYLVYKMARKIAGRPVDY